MTKTNKQAEIDLYMPVQAYFEKLGYTVQAEVNDCDVVAYKDDSLVIIELKLNLNITLLMQAAKRQKITNDVYIAIERPKMSLRKKRWRDLVHLVRRLTKIRPNSNLLSKRWRDLVHLVRRLELGLILVSFEGRRPSLEVVHEPGFFNRKRSINQGKKERTKLIDEAKNRRSNHNIGGSNNVLMMTVYKEKSIQIAYYL